MSAPEGRLTPDDLPETVDALLADEPDAIANMANIAAVLFEALPDINWAGFYILRGDTLVLGPFQGRLACTRIPVGRGVCGTAAGQCQTLVVDDVHAFPGHIACDAASASEIVVPIMVGGSVFGVLDIDSPSRSRFSADDRQMLEGIVRSLAARLATAASHA
ncbi:hypothetical protein AA103196_2497 [Ameyamaea chiangmaiensis NBRC 103196]|uniref:GAF domain-containing protein n=1 Tax=Ameyamaea chiangmaiensis TaxID=442969 RepID=A0A850PBG8_9PROT|nr:GAF domain-containing protein [Ameyamaea chiangmaiensis]MBS4075700.1 GAF domain-containing protein [Ameyamaea chiangmaiensis]NVN40273.1 GAF domain-containing protein [Ameyamaea chiangmaiensis]GBQ70464.1 hypothetical protein AA103196_2497 [Ameyamaea chiangmaiensis NBRC 103196]